MFFNYEEILLTVLFGLQFLIRKFPFCGCRSNMYFHFLLQILWIYSRLCLIKSPPLTIRQKGLDCACMFQLGPLHHTAEPQLHSAGHSWTTAAHCCTQLHYRCTVLHTAEPQLHSATHRCTTATPQLQYSCNTATPWSTIDALQLYHSVMHTCTTATPQLQYSCTATSPWSTIDVLQLYHSVMHSYTLATPQLKYSCTSTALRLLCPTAAV